MSTVQVVQRCLRDGKRRDVGRTPDLPEFAAALRAAGLNGHWEGSLLTWMWQVGEQGVFWIKVPRASRSGRWHAAKEWFH